MSESTTPTTSLQPWERFQFDRTSTARGRNGWFTLDHGDILVFGPPHPRGYVSLWAKREGGNAPIHVTFHTPDDMRQLGQALLAAAEHWDAQPGPTGAQTTTTP
jgi:hypothetical protein